MMSHSRVPLRGPIESTHASRGLSSDCSCCLSAAPSRYLADPQFCAFPTQRRQFLLLLACSTTAFLACSTLFSPFAQPFFSISLLHYPGTHNSTMPPHPHIICAIYDAHLPSQTTPQACLRGMIFIHWEELCRE